MLSKVIWDCSRLALFHSVIFPEKSCHFLNQSNVNLNQSLFGYCLVFFRAEGSLFVVTLSPNWPSVMFFFLWYGAVIRLVSRYFLLPLNLISRALSLPPQRKCFLEGKRERALVTRLYYHYVFLQCGFERRIK